MMWKLTYDTSTDKLVRANARAHLTASIVDTQVEQLQSIVARYQLATGRTPVSFSELVRVGTLRGIPVDPLGNPYVLTSDGRVEVKDPDSLPFIKMGKPLGYKSSKALKLPFE
jgi:hypothetical protein